VTTQRNPVLARFIRLVRLGILLVAGLFFSASAQEGSGGLSELLNASVVVENQTRAQRLIAYEKGMSDVLVRVSGQSSVLENEAIRSALQNATDYMVTYGYNRTEQGLLLEATYSEERILTLLRQAGEPIWRARRPQLMMWIVETQPTGLELLGRDTDHWFVNAVTVQGKNRGLPLNLPLLDLTDRFAITPNDVWGRFEAPVLAATARYPMNGAVMVRLQESIGTWRAEWSVIIQEFQAQGQVESVDKESLGTALANQLTEAVAREFAVNFSAAQTGYTYLRLAGLHSIQQIAAAEQMLRNLGPVAHVTMTRYHLGVAEFELAVIGDSTRVQRALGLERSVEAIEDPWNQVESIFLEYQWLR